jgi:hypothetical protein
MDAARIQSLVYKGRGKAALRIGLLCDVIRPVEGDPRMNVVATIHAAFNARNPNYIKPNLYNYPVWFGDFDGSVTCPGDYLVRKSDGQIWFIAAQQQLLPIVLVNCNRALQLLREPAAAGVGLQPYSSLAGITPPEPETSQTWPCSILIGGRTQAGAGLPSDVKQAGWKILLPPSFQLTVEAGDILLDDLERRFAVESAERSDLGWRLIANEVHT